MVPGDDRRLSSLPEPARGHEPSLAHELRSRIRAIAPNLPEFAARPLVALLSDAGLDDSLDSRISRLEELVEWLRSPRHIQLPPTAPVSGRSSSARLWLLVEVLGERPREAALLADVLRSVLGETRCLSLFCETGLPTKQRFFSELGNRLSRRLLPQPVDDEELAELLLRLFPSSASARWLEELPRGLVSRFVETLFPSANAASEKPQTGPWLPVLRQMAQAIEVLAVTVSAQALAADVRLRSATAGVADSPFLALPRLASRATELALLAIERAGNPDESRSARGACLDCVDNCRQTLGRVRAHLEYFGVSVDLVFRLGFIERLLSRIEALLSQLVPEPGQDARQTGHALLSDLVRDGAHDRSLSHLLFSSSQLLSRKIIERVGRSGDHYITSTREEYHAMVGSAAGGGLLTAGTAIVKSVLSGLTLPLFFEGLFASLNYAGSFLLMQVFGFTLATKQSSVTAASLAGAIRSQGDEYELSELVTQIARVTRSQLAAIFGNIGMVIPGVLAADFLLVWLTGHHVLDAGHAEHYLGSLDPLTTGTVFFASLTGALLWLSSLCAGWLENWTAYRRLPEAIAENRALGRQLGKERAARLASLFADNVSGFGGNVAIGFLLGMTPILGKFFGLPLEVRHVTLSTGQLTLAACQLGTQHVLVPGFFRALLGIALIALCNFGVSFMLALGVAMRARGATLRELPGLTRAVMASLRRNPRPFFLPERAAVRSNAPS